MTPNPNTTKLETVPTIAPMPYMVKGKVADSFKRLKQEVIEQSGIDLLAVCADVMRPKDFSTTKPGAAQKSNHKVGRAFDCDQNSPALVVTSDAHSGRQYFLMWLRCTKQDGSQGQKVTLKDIRGFTKSGYYLNFSALAESLGWSRIPAHTGWGLRGAGYNKMEFWHFEMMEGKTWQQALDDIYKAAPSPVPSLTVLQLGSKGEEVREFQAKLALLGFLKTSDADGNFGPKTEAAVRAFQTAQKLSVDGKIGPFTRDRINKLSGAVPQAMDRPSIEDQQPINRGENKMGFDYNPDEVNAAVDAEADESTTPKPWYATSQFGVLIATYILGPVTIWLAAKGVITPDQAPVLVGIFQTAVVGGIAWVTKKYMDGRNEVSAIKARAAAVRSLGASSPEALAAFRALDRS